MAAKFKVHGQFEVGSPTDATVKIDRELGLFSVRPKYGRREYTMPLAKLAEFVVQRILKQDAENAVKSE